MTYHTTNRNNKEIIIASIPWNPATFTDHVQAGDRISKRVFENNTALAWVYHVTGVTPNMVQAIEFHRVTPIGLIRAANSQVITLSPKFYHPIKVLSQERHEASFRVARELPSLTKPPLFWIFDSGFIDGLPWDPGNGTGRPFPKWGTLHSLATLQSEATETQGNPPRVQTSTPSFKG
jgi:hypothetical protein